MKSTSNLRVLISLLFGCGPLVMATFTLAQQVSFSEIGATVFEGLSINHDSQSATLADIDNDGDLDLMFQAVAGARLHVNYLMQSGALNFERTAVQMDSTVEAWSAAWGDYDSNGFVDVFVGQANNNSSTTRGDVLKNNGGTFTNPSNTIGLNDPGFHQSVAWADIDNDHDLDLLIAMEGPTERHEIYRQDSGGTFTPIGAAVGFQADYGTKAYGMAIGDTDGDGDLDIYISTCQADNDIRNNFFENQLAQTGSLSFIDIAGDYTGDVTTGNGTQIMTNTYSTEFHDFDDDSDLDLFVVGADHQPTKLFRNDGENQFTDVDSILGDAVIQDTGGDYNGGRAVDYDNDGDLDLFFHDHLVGGTNYGRKLFENKGDWEFEDVTAVAGLHTNTLGSYDSVWGDLDRDGDMDLVATTNGSTGNYERVFISNATTMLDPNHWLQVELTGLPGNTTGIGTAIYATINNGTAEEKTLRRDANANAGAFNQNDIPVHFGLGDATTIDQLRIHWPDGTEQYLFDVPVNQHMTIAYAGVKPGDFNRDGAVNTADFVFWSKGFNDMFTERDFELWQKHYGSAPGSGGLGGSDSVPEPATALLLIALGWHALSPRRAWR